MVMAPRGRSVAPSVPLISLLPLVPRVGDAAAADAAGAEQALLQRVIAALHDAAVHGVALVAPLGRADPALGGARFSAQGSGRNDSDKSDQHEPHRHLLMTFNCPLPAAVIPCPLLP